MYFIINISKWSVIEILRKFKGLIDTYWAKYRAFRVVFVISFLSSMIVSAIYVVYALYQYPLFPIIFILVVLGLQKGVFKRIVDSLKHKLNNAWGITLSERSLKKADAGRLVTFFLVFAMGFVFAPFVGVGMLMILELLPFNSGNESIVFGGSIVVYLLLYMGLWFWLKEKVRIKLGFPFNAGSKELAS